MESNNYLLMNVSILYRCGQKYYDKQLSGYNVSASQIPFLILIYENEGISMQELAARGCFDKGTVTKSIQKLEENGYVHSVQSPNDKRSRLLYTSEEAKKILPQIYMIRRKWWERLTADISEEQKNSIEQLLNHLSDQAREYDEQEQAEELRIFGLQKLSLLDYPQKMAATVFTGGCNMRCPFCHNRSLVFLDENTAQLPIEDVTSFFKKRRKVLEGVCISGGEPLLHASLAPFLSFLHSLGYAVKLDTNGSFPTRLKELVEQGLVDYVAMDIKNSLPRYGETAGIAGLDTAGICESVQYLMEGHVPYEFRTTIVKEFHDAADIRQIGTWLKGAKRFYLQSFENRSEVISQGLHSRSKEELKQYAQILKEYIDDVRIRGID